MPAKKSTPERIPAEKPNLSNTSRTTNGTARKNGVHREGIKSDKRGKVIATASQKNKTKKAARTKKTPAQDITAKGNKTSALSVEFRLRFRTTFGQSLFLLGDHPALGEMDAAKAVALEYLDQETWHVRLEIQEPVASIQYHYLIRHQDGTTEYDWGMKAFDAGAFREKEILVIDSWNHAGYFENAFYTEPFRDVLLEKISFSPGRQPAKFTHRFSVKAPLLKKGEVLCLLGNNSVLKNWDTASPVLMGKQAGEDHWTVDIALSGGDSVEYKYGVYDTATQSFLRYEEGPNRYTGPARAGAQLSIDDGFAVLPNDTWKGAGLAIPVFSLRTRNSFGVGEFTDLKLLVDWAKTVGLKMIQVLPVNDTSATHTWKDSYPYAAISAFALHPIYLNLDKITDQKNKHLLQPLEEKRKQLNNEHSVNYCAVIKEKLGFIAQLFPLQKAATFRKKDFREFFRANEHWLVPYAVFCYLRDEYGTSDFNQWPDYNHYNEEAIAALAKTASHDKINIHFFIQYHLHLQLEEATAYAHENKIILKGDIPIGIYRYGADAWQHPELYHIDVQAGAPPDDFAVKGQNWGFPTYNWERMLQDGFKWWRQRFEQMGHYFDAFRIDHILGFFRIWSIPLHAVEGIMGRFVPAIPVHVSEFAEQGIYFDYNRFCRPFITDAVLHEIFGERAEMVKQEFLDYDGFDRYMLKSEFNTQRKVEQYFAGRDDQSLKEGLYDLISNVIFFEEEGSGSTRYHFRFAVHDTLSFRNLDENTQRRLKALYVNYFFERQDHHWEIEAMQKLPGLKRATNMLVCGEDLGMVPHCVPDVMKQLGILSLEIQRMPKAVNRQFFHPSEAPYLSVVMPSTHDMSTVRGWWEEDRKTTQQFYNTELKQPGEAPLHCEPWISKAIVLQHLYSPAMWSIFQLQDLLGMSGELRRDDPSEERINLPSNPQHYWNYRVHISIEDLLQATEFNTELKEYLAASGRN